MATLFIIGNGFDISHGLNTRYNDIKEYIKINDFTMYSQINNQLFIGDEDLWSDFEASVGTNDDYFSERFQQGAGEAYQSGLDMDVGGDWRRGDVWVQTEDNDIARSEAIEEYISNVYESFKFDDLYDRFQVNLVKLLKIAEEESKDKNIDIVKLLERNPNAKFINFNYTHTLEKMYLIDSKDILYIHGELNVSELLFGNDQENIVYLNASDFNLEDLEAKEYQELLDESNKSPKDKSFDISRLGAQHTYNTQPSPNSVNNEPYIEKYNTAKEEWIKYLELDRFEEEILSMNIDKVIVLGHSLGNVDADYFIKLDNLFPKIQWEISFHGKDDVVFSNFEKLGLENRNISFFEI